MIDKNKQYKTRSGLPVRIYATDCGGYYPVHGAIFMDDMWITRSWMSNGLLIAGHKNDRDLIEVKPRIQRTEWFNVYRDRIGCGHKTLEDAQLRRGEGCIACIQIPIDCEEGEGL